MKIGVISDTHDHCDNIERFVDAFERERIDQLIHLGDIVAPFAAKRFARIACRVPFYAIYGNNDGERGGLKNVISEWGTIQDGPIRLQAGGKVIVAHHYPMAASEVRALFPDADYYLSGHTHESVDRTEGRLRLINPGEAGGWLTGSVTAGVLTLETDEWRLIRFE